MDHMGNMYGGYGYSFGGLLGSFIVLLVKLLLIVLVVVVILALAAWVRDNVFKNNDSKIVQAINQDPVLKLVAVTTATVLGLILVLALVGSFTGTGMGGGFLMGGRQGGFQQQGGMGYGFNPGVSIAGLMMTLIQVLTIVFVLSLIVAAVVFVSNQYTSGKLNLFGQKQDTGQDGNQQQQQQQQQSNENQ